MDAETRCHEWKELIGREVKTVPSSRYVHSRFENLACWFGVGMVITERFNPQNREQRLLQELWERSTDNEQRNLSVLLKRIADHHSGHQGPVTRGEKLYFRPEFSLKQVQIDVVTGIRSAIGRTLRRLRPSFQKKSNVSR
ncbi:MAG: DUF3243 domain-containing protein [Firmicutes bacterium]|nr:DUF3243 domain-containing protein [Bacillota bacterium]MBU4532475.1 DUF3243 domain-containing protein [Bacillota bacterium]MBU4554814.1 DUF3243 domain-containing protein [Bacillota bacterium]MBV1728037.1 DUF3243 domain-containing protein [Desulforudis sp.]MBV1735046.1 DUF3243 domain-containing protein [Desulforudis sp.]